MPSSDGISNVFQILTLFFPPQQNFSKTRQIHNLPEFPLFNYELSGWIKCSIKAMLFLKTATCLQLPVRCTQTGRAGLQVGIKM